MGEMMINKQGLIFLTLTSLILVLSVYYVTMPNELLLSTNNSFIETQKEEDDKRVSVSIQNNSVIETMKSVLSSEREKLMKDLNDKLTDKNLSLEEKNNVYNEIKEVNKIKIMEANIEEKIKKEFNYKSFVKVKDDVIEIVINSDKHDTNLAVKIMTLVEKDYPKMYISVSFKA